MKSYEEYTNNHVEIDEMTKSLDNLRQYVIDTYKNDNKEKLDALVESALQQENVKLETADDITKLLQEGLFSGLIGAGASAAIGPKVMQAVCRALNVTSGPLYDLLNSRLVLAAVGYTLFN